MDELLTEYRKTRDPQAFQRLVSRHLDAVYSQCARQLRDTSLAEDATQAVFIMLMNKADTLPRGVVLGGWLFTAARYACANVRRAENRRRKHEQRAAEMRSEMPPSEDAARWEEIEPSLNDAIARLATADRDAVVLRYFEQLSMTEVGGRLGVSEDAARQRVCRAVGKLRREFVGRGLIVPEAMLAVMLEHGAVGKAPAVLIQHVVSGLAKAGVGHAVAQQALRTMTFAKMKAALLAAMVVGAAIGGGAFALQAMQGTAAQAPAAAAIIPAAPATLPVTTAPVAVADATQTPAELTRDLAMQLIAVAKAMGERNEPAMMKLMVVDDSVRCRLVLLGMRDEMASSRLSKAWAIAFPNRQSRAFSHDLDTSMALELMCRLMFTNGANADAATAADDRAVLQLRIPTTGMLQALANTNWSGAQLHFQRVEGQWKMDLAQSCRLAFDVKGKTVSEEVVQQNPAPFEAFLTGLIDLKNTVAGQIESGTLKTPEAADRAIVMRAKALPQGYGDGLVPVDPGPGKTK